MDTTISINLRIPEINYGIKQTANAAIRSYGRLKSRLGLEGRRLL